MAFIHLCPDRNLNLLIYVYFTVYSQNIFALTTLNYESYRLLDFKAKNGQNVHQQNHSTVAKKTNDEFCLQNSSIH